MALPGPGNPLSVNQIATEFGGDVPHGMDEYYRGGTNVPSAPENTGIPTSGQIAINNFYGSSKRTTINLTIASNTAGYDVYANRGPTYIPGLSDIRVTINPGVQVTAASTAAYAFLVPSSFSPADTVTVINNGFIVGAGGGGGVGSTVATGTAAAQPAAAGTGGGGGNAVFVARPVTFTNNGAIAGGGGGGGGGGGYVLATNPTGPTKAPNVNTRRAYGGGGGGGGAGVTVGAGGAGGGASGAPTVPSPANNTAGTSGGSASNPAVSVYNAGGGGPATAPAGAGGAGGALGQSGSTGGTSTYSGAAGGGAGRYMTGNPFVTYPATGTRLGGVS